MIGWILLGLILVFLAVLVIRALAFQPKPQLRTEKDTIPFDKDAAVSALQKLVQCRTISNVDHALEDDGEFQKLIDLLHIPENQKVGCVIGLGYPDEEPAAPKRKSASDLLTYHN